MLVIATFSHIVPQGDGRLRIAVNVQQWPNTLTVDGVPPEPVYTLVETAAADPATVTANAIRTAVRTAVTAAGLLTSADAYFTSGLPDRG